MPSSAHPVVAITGGSAGIGLAIARRFAVAGWSVAIAARGKDRLQIAEATLARLTSSARVLAHACDFLESGAAREFVEQTRQRFGRIDVLVNNAAVAPLAAIDELTHRQIDQLLRINHAAVIEAIQAAWRVFREQAADRGGPPGPAAGTIVNISSIAAVDPFPGFSLYGASKAWLDALTESLAREGQAWGIRLFSVQPGAVETELLRQAFPDYPKEASLSPAEVAEVAFRLTDPHFATASGCAIPVRKPTATL